MTPNPATTTRSRVTGAFQPAERIIVPVQGSDREFMAQQWAVEFAAALALPIHAVHVARVDEEPAEKEAVFSFLERECAKWGVALESRTLEGGDIVEELVAEARARDLIVIGTRRLGGGFHLGSVAGGLVRRAKCPVQIVRLD